MCRSNGSLLDGYTFGIMSLELHQPRLWFITGGYLVKRWFIPAAARARGQSNDSNRGILASNLYNCHNEVINAPQIPSISRCIHIVYRHKNVWEYHWSNFIYNCTSTFIHYVRCKDALLDCSAPGGERCESLTRVDEITSTPYAVLPLFVVRFAACTGGHLGHFHRAISHLKWYKIVCVRYLACTFGQIKYVNMFSMALQSGVPRHFLWRFIAVWIYNLTVFMFMYVNVDLKL